MYEAPLLFIEADANSSFEHLAALFNRSVIDNTIKVSGAYGTGIIRKAHLEPGLYLRVWDTTFKHPFELKKVPDLQDPVSKKFTITYILTQGSFSVKSRLLSKEIKIDEPLNILFASNNSVMDILIAPDHPAKALELTITSEWLLRELGEEVSVFKHFVENIIFNDQPSLFLESATALNYRSVTELHHEVVSGYRNILAMKAIALPLISDLFLKIFNRHSEQLGDTHLVHHEKMIEVEKILKEYLNGHLPYIETIAKQVALSESTLKRHFKLMFGHSIYEYYLQQKMELAKNLIVEKKLSVKETAYTLGYEKTSNFIHMFKKHFNYSPGDLKKRLLISV